MPHINPFIHFNGNAEQAFDFYRSVFGGEFSKIQRFKDLSGDALPLLTENEAQKIMRIVLPIGNGSCIMGSDVPEFMGRVDEHENRSKITIRAESVEEAERLFNGLSEGGQIEVPMEKDLAGSRFGMLRDQYGIEWMVEYDARNA